MEETYIRSLKSRLKYLVKHTKLLEEAGCEHGFAGEIAALEWALPRLEQLTQGFRTEPLGKAVRVSGLASWDQGRTAQAGAHKGILAIGDDGWRLVVNKYSYALGNDELVIVD